MNIQNAIGSPSAADPVRRHSASGNAETALSGAPAPRVESFPFHHPKLEEARRLLNIAPELRTLDIQDEEVRIIAGAHALRRLAEEAAETLIALMDELDGDPDHEEADPGEDAGDREPSLGSAHYPDQRQWASGGDRELEDEHDGREPDEDGEPSLGWTASEAAYGCQPVTGLTLDAELDDCDDEDGDTGIGDPGGIDFDDEWNGDERDYSSADEMGVGVPRDSNPKVRAAADGALAQLLEITRRVNGPGLTFLGDLEECEVIGPGCIRYRLHRSAMRR